MLGVVIVQLYLVTFHRCLASISIRSSVTGFGELLMLWQIFGVYFVIGKILKPLKQIFLLLLLKMAKYCKIIFANWTCCS